MLCAIALCKLLCARCSAQVTLRKLLCASAAGAAGVCSAYYVCTYQKLRFSSRSCGGVLRVLRLYLKVAIFQPELREHAPHTTSVLKNCDFPLGAAGACSAYYVCTQKLRFSSRSGGVLRVLRLYLKVALFRPELREHAPHTTSVLKSYDFPAGAAGARSAYYVCT